MRYFSTKRRSPGVTFRDAVLAGQPADGGLFFPSEVPRWSEEFVKTLPSRSDPAIAFEIIRPYVGGEIRDDVLSEICSDTLSFQFPLVRITPDILSLELFHGPTLAFKDVGARFMSRCLRFFSEGRSRKTLVVVATSGDTGGAVAAGFHGMEGIDVAILYPKGKVSRYQELQLTTFSDNVTTLEVRGSFDDCQRLVKMALSDPDLHKFADLTSANSINIARWLPQQVYYAFAIKQWDSDKPPVFSVPSGNFGNLAAGLLAKRSGLPSDRFIAACNANDTIPRFFRTGKYEPRQPVFTLSNAMDVADPSNFVRIQKLFRGDPAALGHVLEAVSISDADTETTIKNVFAKSGYALDPHGAVAYRALFDHLQERPGSRGIFLETAHPAKFEVTGRILGNYDVAPPALRELSAKPEYKVEVDADYEQVRDVIKSRI